MGRQKLKLWLALKTALGTRSGFGRLLEAVALGVGLFALGQFDEAVFAGLTRSWQAVLDGLGLAAQRLSQPSGLSSHGVVVGLTYRMLYVLVSVRLLHVLLQGCYTRVIALSYAVVFTLSLALLLLGQQAAWSGASGQGHWLLDVVSSPLALLLVYGLVQVRRVGPGVATA